MLQGRVQSETGYSLGTSISSALMASITSCAGRPLMVQPTDCTRIADSALYPLWLPLLPSRKHSPERFQGSLALCGSGCDRDS